MYSTTKSISSLKNIYRLVIIFSNSKKNKSLPFEFVPSPGNRYTCHLRPLIYFAQAFVSLTPNTHSQGKLGKPNPTNPKHSTEISKT